MSICSHRQTRIARRHEHREVRLRYTDINTCRLLSVVTMRRSKASVESQTPRRMLHVISRYPYPTCIATDRLHHRNKVSSVRRAAALLAQSAWQFEKLRPSSGTRIAIPQPSGPSHCATHCSVTGRPALPSIPSRP